jgi:PTS system arbutin/cellobiose/salicin-specific IIC component
VVLSFFLTLLLGFEDIPVEQEQTKEKEQVQPNAVVASASAN